MNIKNIFVVFCFAVTGMLNAQQYSIIPQPTNLQINKGSFSLNKDTQIIIDPHLENEALLLVNDIELIKGIKIEIAKTGTSPRSNYIKFQLIGHWIERPFTGKDRFFRL